MLCEPVKVFGCITSIDTAKVILLVVASPSLMIRVSSFVAEVISGRSAILTEAIVVDESIVYLSAEELSDAFAPVGDEACLFLD